MTEITFDADDIVKFLARTKPGPMGPKGKPCLLWTGAVLTVQGKAKYGKCSVKINGRAVTDYAHRVAWCMQSGTLVPFGCELDHLCRNTLCVQSAHLEAVFGPVNTYRRADAQRAAKEQAWKRRP